MLSALRDIVLLSLTVLLDLTRVARRPGRFTLGLAGLLVASVASAICSVRSPEPIIIVDPPTLRMADADGEDLLVTVAWPETPPPSVELVLETSADPPVTVASWGLVPDAGTVETVRLDAALTAVATHGFTYRLVLVDGAGVTQSTRSFGLAVTCPADGCRYRVLDGAGGTDLPRLSPELYAALDEARTLGADDLFGHVRAHYPELAGDLDGFGLQLARIPGGGATRGCSCRWVEVESYAPVDGLQFGGPSGTPPTHVAGETSAGAGHKVLAQTYDTVAKTTQDLAGTTEYGLVALCTRRKGARPFTLPTEWPSQPTVTFDELIAESCDAPCTPEVDYIVTTTACVLGGARAEAGASTSADAWAAGSVLIDGQMVAVLNVSASARPAPFASLVDRRDDYGGVLGSRQTTAMLATITGTGSLELVADNSGGGYPAYALGGSGFGFRVAMKTDGCPGVPAVFPGVYLESLIDDGSGQGGAVLRSWETLP